MRVSFIIPTLNEALHIKAAVEKAHLAGASEVIVADGGSTDDTAAIAHGLPCQFVPCPRTGRGHQQNAGAAAASGDVLLFLHADNWLAPGAVEQIRALVARTETESEFPTIAGAFRQVIEAEGRLFRWLERGNALRAQRFGLAYGDQAIFLSRGLFQQLGGFAPVRLMEDVDLMRRLRAQHKRIALLPGPVHVSARRWRQHGVLRQTLRNWALLTAFSLGVSPDTLARWYDRRPREESFAEK